MSIVGPKYRVQNTRDPTAEYLHKEKILLQKEFLLFSFSRVTSNCVSNTETGGTFISLNTTVSVRERFAFISRLINAIYSLIKFVVSSPTVIVPFFFRYLNIFFCFRLISVTSAPHMLLHNKVLELRTSPSQQLAVPCKDF